MFTWLPSMNETDSKSRIPSGNCFWLKKVKILIKCFIQTFDSFCSRNSTNLTLLLCFFSSHSIYTSRGSRLQWGKSESQNFNGCPILSQAIGQEKLRTVFVFALAHLEGPPQAFAGYNSKFK